jgi:hypothetical protein
LTEPSTPPASPIGASSIGASSISASSESQLQWSQQPNSQLYQSQLYQSQLYQSQLSESQQQESVRLNWRAVEHSRIPQLVFDRILPTLPPLAQTPYLQLLRLTLGFSRPQCRISIESWATRCNQSVASIKRQAAILEKRGLVRKVQVKFGGPNRGTYWMPIVPGIFNDEAGSQLYQSQLSESQLQQSQLYWSYMISDDDDYRNINNHHQKGVMMTYRRLTGNTWKEEDFISYQKIKDISLDLIEQAIQLALNRAKSHPNSLEYFVREIRRLTNPSQASRSQQKKNIQRIVEQYRALHAGTTTYGIADLTDDVKRACLKEGTAFNNDLFNEIIGMG